MFDPEAFDAKQSVDPTTFEEDRQLAHERDIDECFGSLRGQGSFISGNDYLDAYKRGMEAGITDQELKAYLKQHGIQLEPSVPEPPFSNIRLS